LKLASGIDPNDAVTFTKRDSDITALTTMTTGRSYRFANVDASKTGLWTTALDGDWFTTPYGQRDLRLMTVVFRHDPWSDSAAGTVGLRTSDPILGFTR